MGCDIHCYVEYTPRDVPEHLKDKPLYWYGLGGRINPGRNYAFFYAIAGVRGYDNDAPPRYPLRGMPDDAGFVARGDNHLLVVEDDDSDCEGLCTKKEAEHWVKTGCSVLTDERHVTHPDWHSHSWVTGKEWRETCAQVFTGDTSVWVVEYHALCAAMIELEKHGCNTRVIFWFDN